MFGIIMSAIAGAAMSFQGVFNTRLSEKIGLYESNMFVQGTAFALAAAAMFLLGKGNLGQITHVSKLYLLGGVLGLIITITVMLGMGSLNPTYAVSVILISQLLVAAIIDAFGLFDTKQADFGWNKYVGIAAMIAGVILFKWQRS